MRLKNLFGLPGTTGRSPGFRVRPRRIPPPGQSSECSPIIAGYSIQLKKLVSLVVLLLTSITIYAIPVKYTGCVPESGSSISSFDFTLNFDIADAVADLGTGEWGIGYIGNISSGRYASLYEGSQDEGVEVAKTMTENFTGKSEGFVVNGSTIDIKFPITLKPEIGKTYTLVIRNWFAIFQSGKQPAKSSTYLKFETEPLILTFVGASPSSAELLLQDVSVADGTRLNTLNEVLYTFNENISLKDDAKVSILEGTQTVYESSEVTIASDNAKVLSVKYPDDMKLYNSHNYKLVLPAGTVSLASDNSVVNKEHKVNIEGGAYKYYTVKSTEPTDGATGLFSSVKILYNIPEGTKIFEEGVYSDKFLKMYKDAISEENLIETYFGKATSDNMGMVWDLGPFSPEPSTKYIFHRAEGLGKLFSDTGNTSEWTNEESIIQVTTPSVEELGYPPIVLGDPVVGKHDAGGKVLKNGDSIDALDLIEIAPPDYFYTGKDGNSKFKLYTNTTKQKGYLYDVTTGTPELIKEISLSCTQRETSMFYYQVVSARLGSVFFEGHKYRFVIPEGEFTILYPPLFNYVRTSEYSFEFEGSTPTEAKLLSCTLQEGEERSSLGNVIWTFKGQFELNPEAEAILGRTTGYKSKKLLTSDISNSGNTDVVAHIYSSLTGDPIPLRKGEEWTLTLPEGALYYATDPNIKNKEITISFKGKDEAPEVPEPEFVNIKIAVDGIHTSTIEGIKGRTARLQIAPDEYWEVTALTRDGNDVLPFLEDGAYETPALEADTHIKATIGYKGLVVNDNPAEVVEITGSNAKVYSHGDVIIAEGLNAGDSVAIYTTGGIVIANETVKAGVNSMSFKVRNGEVYLVRVNDKAAKIRH